MTQDQKFHCSWCGEHEPDGPLIMTVHTSGEQYPDVKHDICNMCAQQLKMLVGRMVIEGNDITGVI